MLPDAYCPMLEVQHSGWLHCSDHINLAVMEHYGTHMQTQPGGVIIGVSVHLNVHNPCVLVDFAEAVIEPKHNAAWVCPPYHWPWHKCIHCVS